MNNLSMFLKVRENGKTVAQWHRIDFTTDFDIDGCDVLEHRLFKSDGLPDMQFPKWLEDDNAQNFKKHTKQTAQPQMPHKNETWKRGRR